ncbi:branched-chain amino acid ABC transporter permease [Prauserella sp. PE36]|uniref:ABC transporter substrate-binding protein n=2 Tax=Pseudonocardiaceae TaxID=2070 RepID=A0ABY2S9S8_9PSEU|nr:branched-chain amino acid ABC transporter permease [Prauserella sp. PE36]TKG72423.1 ABC transporter substrate-binding protein [Prauserella endophytica]
MRTGNRVRCALVVGAAAVLTTACATSSGTGGSGGEGLPGTVKIMSIKEMTGPVAFAGTHATRGIDLAVEQINQRKFLGDTKLEIDLHDSAASVQEAASFATQAVSDQSYSALLGPASSSQAAAVSPIADKAKIPVIYTQAGSDGVLVGDYTFRVTAPASSYFHHAGEYLKSKGAKTAAVLYNSGNPTLAELGQRTVPELAKEYGFSVSSSDGVQLTAQDFTNAGAKIARAKPDAVFVLLQGPQNPAAITQLKQNGYSGEIVGMTSMGAGNLKPAGQQAKGTVWPSDFSPHAEAPSVQEFVKAYQAKYNGELPNNYAAEAYDAAWFLARGIKEAGSADRTAIQQGLAAVAKQGFEGAEGKLRFEGNDLRVEGVLAGWDGSGEILVSRGAS